MIFVSGEAKPIYVRLAEWLETEILVGNLAADDRIYSQYQLAEMFNINPATAARSLNILAEEDLLYKKRGLGMFVSTGAKKIIHQKRKEEVLERLVRELVREARLLDISESELSGLIEAAQKKRDKEGRA